MASYQIDLVFQGSLRSPARDAHDSKSCAITRGSVPSDRKSPERERGSVVRALAWPLALASGVVHVVGLLLLDSGTRQRGRPSTI